LGVLLRDEHCDLKILGADKLLGERVAEIEQLRPAAVCVASLPPGDLTATRYVAKRFRTRLPELMLVIGRLGFVSSPERNLQLLKATGVQHIASSLQELRTALLPVIRAFESVSSEPPARAAEA
ncbi:MAG TPA: hypothetical protein VFV10_19400, partial [Gammaproteobacteria bacterium]|nr:hypothetical protein [Gammaproteobacteria bacterium]